MTIARIENGAIAETREIDIAAIPEHKRGPWRPVVIEGDGPTEAQIVEADRLRIVRSWTAEQLSGLKQRLLVAVDEAAERVRLRYITPGPGMVMTYQEKHAQARAVDGLGQGAANALSAQEAQAQFPTLAASVGIEAATLWDCAQLVIQRYEAFATLSYGIEQARLQGKAAVAAATTAAEAQAAHDAVTWPQ